MIEQITQTFSDVAMKIYFLIIKSKSVLKMYILLKMNPHISLILKKYIKVIQILMI